MSVSTQIERLQTDRNTIRDKLIELGLAESTANLTALAAAIADIVNQGAVQVEILEGTSYTIPAGYHNGSGTVKAMTDTTGEAEKYKVQTKTVTPTKSQQSVTPDTGYYALGAVTVNAIPEAYQNVSSVTAAAANVLVGKVFVTADGTVTTGTMANNGAVSQTLDGTTVTYTIPAGYHNGSGKVTISLETKTVTPTKSAQTVTPTSGKVLSQVTVKAIPDEYQDVTGVTATAAKVLEGWKFVDSSGELVTGTMTDNGIVLKELYTNDKSYTIPEGYHPGTGVVKVTSETKTVTPTKSQQTVKSSSNYFLQDVVVKAIPDNYIDTTDATAEAADILSDETAYVNGEKVTGAMVNNGAIDEFISNTSTDKIVSYTIPAGYHDGNGKVSVATSTLTITPEKLNEGEAIIYMGDGAFGSSDIPDGNVSFYRQVVVNGIPDEYQDVTGVTATADKVLTGSVFVDSTGAEVEGTMTNRGAVAKTLSTESGARSYTIPEGYHNGNGIVAISLESKTVTPTKSEQDITPSSGKVLGSVVVEAIPDNYIDTTDADATAAQILAGKTAYVDTAKVTGTMTNRGAVSATIDGLSVTSYTIPAGYHNGSGKVSLTSDIEEALAAI